MKAQHLTPTIAQCPPIHVKPLSRHDHTSAHVIQRDGWMQLNQCTCGTTWWSPRSGAGMVA